MKKEEFPTFLNEQPTVIFGRTGRELLIIACGAALTYDIWDQTGGFTGSISATIINAILAAIPAIIAFIIALFPIAGRPLEEWIFILFLYAFIPKRYIYMPFKEEVPIRKEAIQIEEPRWLFRHKDDDDEQD